ncbi:MAG: type IV pilus modification PilV family protein [Planctomycetota bacterium]
MRMRSAFTLVEVAIAMAVLVIGLSAATGVYITGLRWASETRHQYTATKTAGLVVQDARLLRAGLRSEAPAGYDNGHDDAQGWLNGYYCVRTVTDRTTLPGRGGDLCSLEIRIYADGDASSGELIHTVASTMIARP